MAMMSSQTDKLPQPDLIRVGLVRLLYSALPQVASVTTGVVVGAWLVVWRSGSGWDLLLAWLASGMAAGRLGLLVAFH